MGSNTLQGRTNLLSINRKFKIEAAPSRKHWHLSLFIFMQLSHISKLTSHLNTIHNKINHNPPPNKVKWNLYSTYNIIQSPKSKSHPLNYQHSQPKPQSIRTNMKLKIKQNKNAWERKHTYVNFLPPVYSFWQRSLSSSAVSSRKDSFTHNTNANTFQFQ